MPDSMTEAREAFRHAKAERASVDAVKRAAHHDTDELATAHHRSSSRHGEEPRGLRRRLMRTMRRRPPKLAPPRGRPKEWKHPPIRRSVQPLKEPS